MDLYIYIYIYINMLMMILRASGSSWGSWPQDWVSASPPARLIYHNAYDAQCILTTAKRFGFWTIKCIWKQTPANRNPVCARSVSVLRSFSAHGRAQILCLETTNVILSSHLGEHCSKVWDCRPILLLVWQTCGIFSELEHNTTQYYTILHHTAQYYTILHNTNQYYTILHDTITLLHNT